MPLKITTEESIGASERESAICGGCGTDRRPRSHSGPLLDQPTSRLAFFYDPFYKYVREPALLGRRDRQRPGNTAAKINDNGTGKIYELIHARLCCCFFGNQERQLRRINTERQVSACNVTRK